MEYVVDLHIHSHYSRATSLEMNIQALYRWGKIKGIDVMGTGDFTHPAWFSELREKLEPAESGLFKLKEEYAKLEDIQLPEILRKRIVRFILTVEISNMYSKGGKGRRLHNLVIAPSFESVSEINERLTKMGGNIKSDGRPILGIDSKELLRVTTETDPSNLFIPAHIWTPWFAMFGSKSGFDTIEEAFEELSSHVVAVETGLSSDPFMNWRLSQLDNLTIISNSDAHSPSKLGREANIISSELSYEGIIGAVKTNDKRFIGTIEFFPQEGKYHYDGHRLCNISMPPHESKKLNNICPACGNELILGVDHRVEDLADRPPSFKPKKHKEVEYIVPLIEIISEVMKVSVNSKKVKNEYHNVLFSLGDEFSVLRNVSVKDIEKAGSKDLATAVEKMRKKDIFIKPGYDGVYGVVKIFDARQKDGSNSQLQIEF